MKSLLTFIFVCIAIAAFAGVGVQLTETRDYGTQLTYNVVSVPSGLVTTLNDTTASHEWILQNIGTNNVMVWFDNTVTGNKGFLLQPAMIIGDNGNHRMFAYANTQTSVTVYERLTDFCPAISTY